MYDNKKYSVKVSIRAVVVRFTREAEQNLERQRPGPGDKPRQKPDSMEGRGRLRLKRPSEHCPC
jgi:hypothetical protein